MHTNLLAPSQMHRFRYHHLNLLDYYSLARYFQTNMISEFENYKKKTFKMNLISDYLYDKYHKGKIKWKFNTEFPRPNPFKIPA